MINLIFTLDYEIYGNGDGDPYTLMVEPTSRLLSLFEAYQAKLTIMAEVVEISKFKEYYELTGEDKFHYCDISNQLLDAFLHGHSVQLHIHSSFCKADYYNNKWRTCLDEYDLASLPASRINEIVESSVSFINTLFSGHSYSCSAFRAGGWGMMPTPNLYSALIANGITKDSSVYKWGRNSGLTNYDYSLAFSNVGSYPASSNNINEYDSSGKIIEYPIYSENVNAFKFLSIMRLYRVFTSRLHKSEQHSSSIPTSSLHYDSFSNRSLKYDFNKLSLPQLKHMFYDCLKDFHNKDIDVVLIGHSKSFTAYNELILKKFLEFLNGRSDVKFGTL